MLFYPAKIREIIGKAASTSKIHFTELSLRMIPAFAMLGISGQSNYGTFFKVLGLFMIFSSIILMLLPRAWHHNYARLCARVLSPSRIRYLSPISVLAGLLILYFSKN